MTEPSLKRKTWTYELVIHSSMGRFKFYLAVSENETATPIEIWIDCAKEGAMLRELMHAWAATFSVALQHGTPVRRFVKLFRKWEFEPKGKVDGLDGIASCESILDLVAQVLEKDWPLEATA